MVIKAGTLRGYLQGISGLFISKDNPGGLTPKELDILTAIVFIMGKEKKTCINALIKHDVAILTGHPVQVITNYVKKLRDKQVLDQKNTLHRLLIDKHVILHYKDQDNV